MTEEDIQKLRDAYSQDPDPKMDPAPPEFRGPGVKPRERNLVAEPTRVNYRDYYEAPETYRNKRNGE